MSEIRTSAKTVLLVIIAAAFGIAFARADSYSWQNFQSDIAGVAAHTDPDLVNPWGMSVSSGGTIWVANNGTGTATLYRQDGTKNPLVVTIPKAARNKGDGNPTGNVLNSTAFFVVTKNGVSGPLDSSSPAKTVRFQDGTRRSTAPTQLSRWITEGITATTAPSIRAWRSAWPVVITSST